MAHGVQPVMVQMQCTGFQAPGPRPASRVLIADDQPDVRLALELLLKSVSIRVEAAASPVEVLAAVRARSFDAVLLDLNYTRDTTSGAEGLDLLSSLGGLAQRIPVIVMTAWGTIEVEAMRRGARDFILKPWDNRALLATLQRHIGESKEADAPGLPGDSAIGEDLAVARQVQCNLLPRNLKPVPTLEYGGACLQARGVGGDYYDFLEDAGGRFACVLADVSGKGIAAALLMANLQATLRSEIRGKAGALPALLGGVNRLFCDSTEPPNFATLFFGSYDPGTRTLRYVNCGHNPPLLLRAGGEVERLEATATVLGVFRDWTCTDEQRTLREGDLLVIYSDGVTEAGRDGSSEFGEERLIAAARRLGSENVQDLVSSVTEEVREWGGPVPADDITLVILRGAP
jgi:sigma-B regulation protein RsbU (phosphoserine phosphatase)